MDRAIQMIDENTDKPYTNEELCAKLKVSEEVLYTCFRHRFDATPHEYQVKVKMMEAARELIETDDAVNKIAMHAGYGHGSSFTREFRKWFDYSPEEFRELKKGVISAE